MADIWKRDQLQRLLSALAALERHCIAYQGYSGVQENERLFRFVELIDQDFTKGRAAFDALAAVLTNPQINALMDEFIEPAGANVVATLGAIQTAVQNLQDTFAAQLGAGIDGRERERVNRAWVQVTHTAAARTPIDTEVAGLRTALAPLVV